MTVFVRQTKKGGFAVVVDSAAAVEHENHMPVAACHLGLQCNASCCDASDDDALEAFHAWASWNGHIQAACRLGKAGACAAHRKSSTCLLPDDDDDGGNTVAEVLRNNREGLRDTHRKDEKEDHRVLVDTACSHRLAHSFLDAVASSWALLLLHLHREAHFQGSCEHSPDSCSWEVLLLVAALKMVAVRGADAVVVDSNGVVAAWLNCVRDQCCFEK